MRPDEMTPEQWLEWRTQQDRAIREYLEDGGS